LKINPIRTPCDRCAPSTPYLPRDVRYPFALSVQIRHFRVVTPTSASNSGAMPAATRLSQLSRLSCAMLSTPFKSPVRRWPCHRPEHGRPRTPPREGAAGFDGDGAAAAQRGTAPSNSVAGRGSRDRLSPFQRRSRPAHAVTAGQGPRPWPHARIVTLCAKTACGLGRSLQAEIEPCPKGRARYVFLMSK